MTDNDIIKALECCVHVGCVGCIECQFDDTPYCMDVLHRHVLDLVTRQKAEIERLQHIRAELSKENEEYDRAIINALHRMKVVRAEAIKETVKRLKEGCGRVKTEGKTMLVFSESAFDYIAKEMTEGEDESVVG